MYTMEFERMDLSQLEIFDILKFFLSFLDRIKSTNWKKVKISFFFFWRKHDDECYTLIMNARNKIDQKFLFFPRFRSEQPMTFFDRSNILAKVGLTWFYSYNLCKYVNS